MDGVLAAAVPHLRRAAGDFARSAPLISGSRGTAAVPLS
jgi:hypothetical protein